MPFMMQQTWSTRSNSSSESSPSDGFSQRSVSTAHTHHSPRSFIKSQSQAEYPQHKYYHSSRRYSYDQSDTERASVESYTSTIPSIDNFDDNLPGFAVPHYRIDALPSIAMASTPHDFADYFPSTNTLAIKHDDATDDGNMNLRVDAVTSTSGRGKVDLTLFHLRMYDLRRREFSLRRYCRDSGKQVCHSTRKYTKSSPFGRPALQRSMSNALSSLRSKSECKTSMTGTLRRQGSGYASISEDDDDDGGMIVSPHPQVNLSIERPSNIIMLEFSNYAHLEVRRRGAKSSRRYEFQYWGTKYAWKRVAMRSGGFREISYHLVDLSSSNSVAHIVPVPLSDAEARAEEAKGG